MSCACENKRMAQEYERIRGLAKAWAQIEGKTALTYKKVDGTYGFTSCLDAQDTDIKIVEYVTPY